MQQHTTLTKFSKCKTALAVQSVLSLLTTVPFATLSIATAHAQQANDVVVLPSTSVVGSYSEPYAPLKEYAPVSTSTGTKTNTNILKAPQTVNVIGQKQMQATGATTVMDALRYTPGVSQGNSDNDIWQSFYVRGFKARRAYRDGMKFQVDAYDGKQEPYGVERIEVSKGPSSFAFAGDEPGGTINTISKRPTSQPLAELVAGAGSFDEKFIMGDFSDKLTADGSAKFRVVTALRSEGSKTKHINSERVYLAPSLAWQINDATKLTLLGEFQRDDATPLESGIPRDAVINNPNGTMPRTTFLGEPSVERFKNNRTSFGYEFNHDFSDNLSLVHKARIFKTEPRLAYTENYSLSDDKKTLNRGRVRLQNRSSEQFTTDNYLSTHFGTGAWEHNFIAGFDYISDKAIVTTTKTPTTNGDLDIFNPVYGNLQLDTANANVSGRIDRLTQKGVYLQNQSNIGALALTLGGRYGVFEFGETPTGEKANLDEDDGFTGRVGLAYEFANGVAPYVSYSQSFNHQGGKTEDGKLVQPSRGEQVEAGVRYKPHENLLLSAVAYQIDKSDVAERNPENRDFKVVVGEVSSTGFELEAQGKITPDLGVVAAYSQVKQETKSSIDPAVVNKVTKDLPKNQASLWLDYQLTALSLPNTKIGAGVRYVGDTEFFGKSTIEGYTSYDASLTHRYQNFDFGLHATNLTDEEQISCAYECSFGQARSITGKVAYRF